MKKFHIVDKKLSVIDSSNNMLELRMSCHELNTRFPEEGNECEVFSTAQYNKMKAEVEEK